MPPPLGQGDGGVPAITAGTQTWEIYFRLGSEVPRVREIVEIGEVAEVRAIGPTLTGRAVPLAHDEGLNPEQVIARMEPAA